MRDLGFMNPTIVIGKAPSLRMDDNGTLWFGKRLCVPENKAMLDAIIHEAVLLATSRTSFGEPVNNFLLEGYYILS